MQEQPLIKSEMTALDRQIADAFEKSNCNSEALSRLESDNVAREERIRRLDGQIVLLNDERSRLSERVTEARVAVAELMQRRNLMGDTLRSVREACQASEEAVRGAARESEDSAGRIAQAERAILTAESRLAELYLQKEQRDADLLARRRRRAPARGPGTRPRVTSQGPCRRGFSRDPRLPGSRLKPRLQGHAPAVRGGRLACRASAPIPTIRCLIAAGGRPAPRNTGDSNGLE